MESYCAFFMIVLLLESSGLFTAAVFGRDWATFCSISPVSEDINQGKERERGGGRRVQELIFILVLGLHNKDTYMEMDVMSLDKLTIGTYGG